ncbi:hypothetical protein EBE87_26790 [Pseudoroseomonas wenyumeiae]|uniref:Ribbon-helix-helix protein, CopG family n=1 Tax=Teichococcus wenyumeiae TaxID=2478470 RepID=A0A3A9J7G3_9PROT|nr:hypothetical protein [Pseudoroseomonas wenyumeiae]RKK02402.1 hypothetical protein D6Z83_19990 [Pseudoroseomonas wenyumeiae]RMI15204.1 hypothetical protein EBE87_26790 [Pseudoroseomonas wenyumeiae]
MASPPAKIDASLLVRKTDLPPTVAPPKPEAPVTPSGAPVREGLTIRILASDSERLRTLAFKTRQKKQALLDEAIRQYLDKMGV